MQPQFSSSSSQSLDRWEHTWLSLQWHSGFAGLGKGWDQPMVTQIQQLGQQGYEMTGVVQQKDPTWFILFF